VTETESAISPPSETFAIDTESETHRVAWDAEACIRVAAVYDAWPTLKPDTVKESPPVDANEIDTTEETDAPMYENA